MSVDDRINSLLLRWQDEQAKGRDLSAAELCHECPELAPALGEKIRLLRHMDALLQSAAGTSNPQMPIASNSSGVPQTSNGLQASKATDPWATAPPSAEPDPKDPCATVPPCAEPGPHDGCATAGYLAPPRGDDFPAQASNRSKPEKRFLDSIPGYELLEKIGEGGMGIVYKARQIQLNRIVALKMILAGSHASSEVEARFLQEAELIARLKHPNVVQVYEFGKSPRDGIPFFSLEFLEGGSLAGRLKGEPQSSMETAQMVLALARGMQAAHQQGIIHRDLKPANVLLSDGGREARDDEGKAESRPAPRTSSLFTTPKITDFGLAKQLDNEDGRTRTGMVMGTPSYMAPEQAEGKTKEIGPSADIYALGAILYEMLTGRPPFKSATAWDTVKMVIDTEPVPPRQLNVQAPRDLETICLKCLQKEPAKRYKSCADLADDVKRWMDGEPINARRISALERGIKWARRKPYQALLTGALVSLFAVIFGAVVIWQAQETRRYKEKFERLERASEVRQGVEQNLLAARQAETLNRWSEAKNLLEQAVAALESNPDIQAEELRAELHQRLQRAAKGQQALGRLEASRPLYDEALFHATPFTGLDLAANRARTKTAARAFLAIYQVDADADARTTLLEQDQPFLAAPAFDRQVQCCYKVLLVWADAEATPLPGEIGAAEQAKNRASHGLQLLARAARLASAYQFDSQTYHLHKARYTALSKGEEVPTDDGLPEGAPAFPTGALDWFFKGLQSYRADRYEIASQECARALELQEDHFWARYTLALCHLRLGNWAEAKSELTVCLGRRHDFVWLLLLRGFGSSEMGNRSIEVARQYEQLKDVDKAKRERERAHREFAAAEADFNRALLHDNDPVVRYAGLNNRGVLFIRQQKWKDAIADLRDAVKLKPAALASYVNLARAHEGAKQSDQAVAALNQAVKLAPSSAAIYDLRGELHKSRGDREAARADLRRAIALWPIKSNPSRLTELHLELGQLLQRDKLYEEALKPFAAALAIESKNENAYRLKAESLLALDRRQEAGAALDHYLKVAAQPSAKVCKARGMIYEQSGHYSDAVTLYTLALRQAPDDQNTRNLRGWVYLFMDAARPALADFEKVLETEPTNAEALAGRGNARIRLRMVKEAIADAEIALKHGPQTDHLLYNVTSIYALAVAQMEYAVRIGRDRQAKSLLVLYEKNALDCLGRALEARPREKQTPFWRDVVQNDPLLEPIRRSEGFKFLARKYGGK